MHDGPHRTRRAGFTLVEVMVVVAIIVLLMALLLPAIQAVRDRAKIDKARTQMQMIAMAIDEYARFWPPSPISAKGLPPWDFTDLWDGAGPDWQYDISEVNEPNDMWEANECLAWCLTAKVGTGPYLKQPPAGMVEYLTGQDGTPLLFPPPATGDQMQRVRLVDPWGTPYFYCWVRDAGSWILPADPPPDDGHIPTAEASFRENKAFGFVLISAGPNRNFDFKLCGAGLYCTQDDNFGDDIVYGHGG